MSNKISSLSLLFLLSACSSNSYQPAGPDGRMSPGIGYQERKISHNKFVVSYAGSMSDSQSTVEALLMRRVKEVAQTQCMDSYTISDRESESFTLTRGPAQLGISWREYATVTCEKVDMPNLSDKLDSLSGLHLRKIITNTSLPLQK